MRKSLLVTLAGLACVFACSCTTAPQKREVFMDARCVIETETPGVLVEVFLDGGLVFSGKTTKEKEMNLSGCNISTSPGKHHLTVSAPGYATWDKEVSVVGGTSQFWAELQKQ